MTINLQSICYEPITSIHRYLCLKYVVAAFNYSFVKQIIYLFGLLCHFQHCTCHVMVGSWQGRGNQYIQLVKVLYCKLPTNGKQLPTFPLEAWLGFKLLSQRWEARALPLCHRGPLSNK